MKKLEIIEQKITDFLPSLGKNQKKIAEFILNNMNLIALLPIREAALRAGVSEATMVRFAQNLGYRGYKELKDQFNTSLKNHFSPTEIFKFAETELHPKHDRLFLVAQNVIQNIKNTVKTIDRFAFDGAVNAIIGAERIYCMGLEISSHFAKQLTFLLRLYNYHADYVSLDFLRYREQIAFFDTNDIIIAFSFTPYSRETVEAIGYAKDKGIETVAFTDKKTSPITEHAKYNLHIKTDNIMFTNSLGAVSVVLNAIITELNLRDKERTLKALQVIEENIKDDRYFIN